MRGDDEKQAGLFSYVTLEQRISCDHPAGQIRFLADRALERMDAELGKLYSTTGRPSIASAAGLVDSGLGGGAQLYRQADHAGR